MRSSNEFITLMMDIGEEKARFRNYLKHQAQRKKRPKHGYCNNHCSKYIYQRQNTFLGPILVCHYLLYQMIFIRQTFSIHSHDKFKKKAYKYVLNIVDVASRYKASHQLTSKNSKEVAQVFQWIYENTPLTYPKTLIIDDDKEFYGDTTKLMEKHGVMIQRGDPSQKKHRKELLKDLIER